VRESKERKSNIQTKGGRAKAAKLEIGLKIRDGDPSVFMMGTAEESPNSDRGRPPP
jgi:hypothetical protein